MADKNELILNTVEHFPGLSDSKPGVKYVFENPIYTSTLIILRKSRINLQKWLKLILQNHDTDYLNPRFNSFQITEYQLQ